MNKKYWLLIIGSSYAKSSLVLLFALFIYSSISAKPAKVTSKYILELLGANIGEFSVTQTSDNGKTTIEAVTDVNIKLLFSHRVKYIQKTVYEKGALKSSNVKTYKNEKLNSEITILQENDVYMLVVDGDSTLINDSITYSGSLLYFNEPKGIKQLYKERTAEMRQITPLSEHTYVVNDENKRELNRYIYKNGVLEYAKMQHSPGTLELKRVTEY